MGIGTMREVCLIPARIGSTRFPRKPLALISGVPMIIRVAERASEVFGKEGTYVVTDSSEIEDLALSSGFSAVRVDEDVPTGTDRIARTVSLIQGVGRFYNLQGDEPLVSPADLQAFRLASSQLGAEVTNGFIAKSGDARKSSPNAIKLAINADSGLMYASRSPIPFGASASNLQVCMYSFTPEALAWFAATERGPLERAENIEIMRFIENGRSVKMLETFSASHAVDVPADIAVVESILALQSNPNG